MGRGLLFYSQWQALDHYICPLQYVIHLNLDLVDFFTMRHHKCLHVFLRSSDFMY